MNRFACLAAVAVLGIASLTGCVSSPATDDSGAVHLTLLPGRRVRFDGKILGYSALPQALQSRDVARGTPLIVEISPTTAKPDMTALASQLASAGYRTMVFRQPRHVDVTRNTPPKAH